MNLALFLMESSDGSGGLYTLLGFIVIAFLGIVGLLFYFIPTIVAIWRKHRNQTAIILLNIFLGWTLLGWLGALIWAVVEEKQQPARLGGY